MWEQDVSTFSTNASTLKLEAILFKKYRPFIEFQNKQAIAGLNYFWKISDKLSVKMQMDGIVRNR